MPRKPQASSNLSTANRRQIRKWKRELFDLVHEQAEVIAAVAKADPREARRMIDLLTEEATTKPKKRLNPLDPRCLDAVTRELASGFSALISIPKVAYLGPCHSYSHQATLQHFGSSADLIAVRTISSVFQDVSAKNADAGVVPIENSTDGRIVDTLEMFARCPVKIVGELPLRIHHNLLGIGPRSQVEEVLSKPQAISQCREWLANHLPSAKITPTSSTTTAAERASHDPAVAAIASRQAGVEYGLEVIAENIEDNPNNVTRFAVISLQDAEKTGDDKTALMFELNHEPGALADATSIFKRNKLNLTWIESLPKPGSPNEYLFFVEFEGHTKDLRVRKALASLDKKTASIQVLGSYPRQKNAAT